MENNKRVVVTGMGVVAPNGIGIENFWDSLVQGRSGIRKIIHFDVSSYPCQIAGIVPDFDPTRFMDPKTAKRLSRFAHFAFASSQMAVDDSGIDFGREDPFRTGVFVGTAIGGGDIIEIQHNIFLEKGVKRINPYAVVAISTHSGSGIISCEYNLKGPNTTISAGCNSGLDATYLASNAIRLGDADVMIVGAGESPITPYVQALFSASGFLSRENREPWKALKPYDSNADGMVLGEGGGCLVVEELEHALKRGAKIYGEIVSYSALNEAFDLFGVDANNETMVLNFRQVLKKAKMHIEEVDYINAHGNGLLSYDTSETKAIKEVFGELAYNIPVTSLKPNTGHSLSATGLFQIISSLLSINHNIIPPTMNIRNPSPECDLNYVPDHFLRKEIQNVLVNAHGFGGRLTALILRKFSHEKLVS
jgi:3-oxoacyl-[acyl-carrier-protein] synthase II